MKEITQRALTCCAWARRSWKGYKKRMRKKAPCLLHEKGAMTQSEAQALEWLKLEWLKVSRLLFKSSRAHDFHVCMSFARSWTEWAIQQTRRRTNVKLITVTGPSKFASWCLGGSRGGRMLILRRTLQDQRSTQTWTWSRLVVSRSVRVPICRFAGQTNMSICWVVTICWKWTQSGIWWNSKSMTRWCSRLPGADLHILPSQAASPTRDWRSSC